MSLDALVVPGTEPMRPASLWQQRGDARVVAVLGAVLFLVLPFPLFFWCLGAPVIHRGSLLFVPVVLVAYALYVLIYRANWQDSNMYKTCGIATIGIVGYGCVLGILIVQYLVWQGKIAINVSLKKPVMAIMEMMLRKRF